MTSRDFCYWLQGFFEINGNANASLDVNQTIMVRNHLNMVFVHEIDPSHGDAAHQAELSAAHIGSPDWAKHIDAMTQAQLAAAVADPTTRPYGKEYGRMLLRLLNFIAAQGGGSAAPGPKLQDLEEGLARGLKPGADTLINC